MSQTAEASARVGGVLAATCISTLVVNANTSAVSILLPAISDDTGTSVETLQWAVTGYSLVAAAVIITSGSLGDLFGRKRVFQLGLLLFVVSCVLIALAQSGGMVIAGRVIQGAAGATILACGLSLLSVANSGQAQIRAVSLWGAAAAVGAAAGPLLGGVLVEVTGWQGLFWIDAGVAVLCMVLTYVTVSESRDPERPRSIDYAGTLLVALTLVPLILAFTKSGEWGWISVATLGCFAITIAAGIAFVVVEGRVAVPLLDLALLRNRVLVGSTIAILIGAGTINALMFLLSLYFQDPATLDFSPLDAGLATLPATVGLVLVAPLVPRLAAKFGGRQTIGIGFVLTTAGFVIMGLVDDSWKYAAFLLPLIAIAVGMGLSNGPASSAATASVPQSQVGEASGVSNMARYVGAAVATALAATIYGTVTANHTADGASQANALASGLAAASWMMAIFSFLGVLMAFVMARHPAPVGTVDDALVAAAAHTQTLPTSATAGRADTAPTGWDRMTTTERTPPAPFTSDDYAARMRHAVAAAAHAGLDGLLVTPGPELVWLTGYRPPAVTERLTLLVLVPGQAPTLLVPTLERADAEGAVGAPSIAITDWADGEDPFSRAGALIPEHTALGISDSAWAMHLLGLQATVPGTSYRSLTQSLPMLRAVKDTSEIVRLEAAGAAADATYEQILRLRFAGRKETEVAADLARLLREFGHDQVDFTVVGSGPNGANPHHEAGGRVIEAGDAIVLDFGGLMDGYGSDTSRTVCVGEPSAEVREVHEIVRLAQQAGVDAVRPGVACQEIDRAARSVITDAGYGEQFIHRTGHGIGTTTHEPPYMIEGEEQRLVPGMCFSVEPGVYLAGRFGVRIEDIVTVTETGGRRLNNTERRLQLVE